ncbi:MAG: c-type cytochrome [Pirellulales bacterium]|nr:c-type cytochrome [Pirellulales bacterium]
MPPAVRLAPGSPTGLVSGAGTKFPRSYQQAMFVGDWSRGTIYAVHLSPVGASYHGQCEPLATGVGGVTDLIVSPTDGALYFTVGGRQTQGGLYRIVWDGPSASAAGAAADGAAVADDTAAKARAARRALEELHGEHASGAESPAWAGLSSPDRFIRYAALTALERVDASSWQDRALGETDLLARFTALMALARRDQPAQPHKWVGAIAAVEFHKLSEQEQQTVVRATSLGVMRFRNLDSALRKRLATTVSEWRPTQRRAVDRELAKLLVRLESADIVPALVAELHAAAASEAAIDAAVTLSAARAGWSTESRSALLDWFDEAAKRYGGRSFYPYLVAARARFVAGFDALERVQFAERLAPPVRPEDDSDFETPRKFVKRWTANEVVRVVERSEQESPAGESAALDGRRVFLALGCADCHAVAGEGSSVGPDLTNVGRRYSVADLARAITQPSDEVPDLYRQTTFVSGGRAITGRPTNMTSTTISVTTDMRDPASAVKLQRDEIESQSLSPTSAMPSNLLDTLTADEVAALFAYLREPSRETAGGRPSATID